jgi:outer membrane receptor protein involved in Fe transport
MANPRTATFGSRRRRRQLAGALSALALSFVRVALAQAPEPEPAPAPPVASTPAPARADEPSYGAVAVTPAPGGRTALRRVPRNVQTIDSETLSERRSLGLHDTLAARLGSATLSDVQNNPLQPDLQLRGFTASPLLGTPQGVAVYQNGVRLNDPFGDVVQWELVPMFAVGEVQLLPGANPVYGWNALGGSLVLRTKDGFRDPGHRFAASAGSFGRYELSGEYGESWEPWAIYAGVSLFGEQGFRDASLSRATNVHADARHRRGDDETAFSVSFADTQLRGNGPAPIELLEVSRRRLFTYPDITTSEHLLASASLQRALTERLSLQATAYLRHLARDTRNADEAELTVCAGADGTALTCDEDDEPLRSELDTAIPAGDPGFDALDNSTATRSAGYGGSLQLALKAPLVGRPNELLVGAAYGGAQIAFVQRAQLAWLTPERTVQDAGVFLAGAGYRTALEVEHRALGVYASDTWDLQEQVALTVAARMDWANVELLDREGDALDGDHAFTRVNPALGATYTPVPAVTLFAGYGESSRTPSAAELACADPDQPCRVPNAFVADPALEQVVSRSVELGARGRLGASSKRPLLQWSLAGFGSRNYDDILFVAGSRVGTGYFRNAGQTQRVGLELGLSGAVGVLRWQASYALLRATFESALLLPGSAHPFAMSAGADDADDEASAVIAVEPGDRIPGLPAHAVRGDLEFEVLPGLTLGADAQGQSSQPFRGDEANLLDPVPGFVLLGAHASYQPLPQLTLHVHAQNLLDSDYETFGVIADPSEVLPGTSDPRFLSPGAPLGVWAGVTLEGP